MKLAYKKVITVKYVYDSVGTVIECITTEEYFEGGDQS